MTAQLCTALAGLQALHDPPQAQPPSHLLQAVDGALAAGGGAAVAQELLRLAEAASTSHVARLWEDLEHGGGAPALEAALATLCHAVDSVHTFLASVRDHVLACARLPPLERVSWMGLDQLYGRRLAAAVLAGRDLPPLVHEFFAGRLAELSAAVQASDADGMAEEGTSTAAQGVRAVANSLRLLGLEVLTQEACSAAVCDHLREELFQSASGGFEEGILQRALQYSATVPLQFLALALLGGDAGGAKLQEWRARLSYFVFEVVGSKRIADLFDIVVDFPESLPAVHDLRDCLRNTNLHGKLVRVFGRAIQSRLLHPGAATTDIIQQYVSTIRALQHIDPSGVILDTVGDPIREYLRSRKDTIRCIVTMLSDDGEDAAAASLLAELGTVDLGAEDADADFESADADEQALAEAERWEPDPVEADPSRRSGVQQAGDILTMLVGIYGSRDLFIGEYRAMLAERLLAKTSYDCDRELRTLELLKVRFGEASLHNAEIMLKDLADSKRVNANVKSVPDTATPIKRRANLVGIQQLDATIISQLFWPQLPKEDFKLPPQMRSMLDTYGAKYHSLKAPRKLEWKPNLGTVELDLTIGGQELQFAVSPLHASILLHFRQRQSWGAAELAAELGLASEALHKKALFWISQGVLSETRGGGEVSYHRNDELQSNVAGLAGEGDMDVEAGGQQDEDQQMSKYEPFVMGMLTNFDALPLDRIHNMLKMFVTDPPYDKTVEQLGAFLQGLVAAEKLVLSGGMYKKR
eukprot:scaffold1.g5758.t1